MTLEGMLCPRVRFHLSHGERSDRLGDAKGIVRSDPGEGLQHIDKPYPLTPALSPWERGRTEL